MLSHQIFSFFATFTMIDANLLTSQPNESALIKHRWALLVAFGIFTFIYSGWAIYMQSIIDSFQPLIRAMGNQAPAHLILFVEGRYLWWVIPATISVPAIALLISPRDQNGLQRKLLVILFVCLVPVIAIFILLVWAIAQPMRPHE